MKEPDLESILQVLPNEWQPQIKLFNTASDTGCDGELTIQLNQKTKHYLLAFKQIHRKESLVHYSHAHSNKQRILVCNPLSTYLRDICTELNVNYIDESGNIRITDDSTYILIQGQKSVASKAIATMTTGIVKCLFAFFAEPSLLNEPYSLIAERAGISLGMVNKTMTFLIENKHIAHQPTPRRFLDVQTLQYEWLISYQQKVAPKIPSIVCPPPENWESVPLNAGDIWAGEVAAAQLTNYLIPQDYLLFTQSMRPEKYPISKNHNAKLRMKKAFWGKALSISQNAFALLTVAELLSSNDGRNRELAEMINDQYLHLTKLP